MATLAWIVLFSLLMSAIALVGSITLVLKPATLDRLLLPLVAFAAGSLIGGALFHMIPTAVHQMGNGIGSMSGSQRDLCCSSRWSSFCSGTTATVWRPRTRSLSRI